MLLIGNGKVITRDSANPYLENGAVVTDGENIKEVGILDAMKRKYPEAEFVDAHGGVIMPGLINAHTHIYSGDWQEAFPSCKAIIRPFPGSSGRNLVGHRPSALDLDGTRACAWATVLDCIRDGVTPSSITTQVSVRSRVPCLQSAT